ncbi:hypothetical protein DFJ74DRAFT_702050 [Hyaloraphidium curvatum]|nr:hypothetical protein DFJ74DRAFT_702050 [Hyaloraphidium curvatum]
MGAWSLDVWADDDNLTLVLAVATAAGLIPPNRINPYKILMGSSSSGGRIINRFTPSEYTEIANAMDSLTPEQLAELDADAMVEKGGGLDQDMHPALWALLCMHAGASIPPKFLASALSNFGPSGSPDGSGERNPDTWSVGVQHQCSSCHDPEPFIEAEKKYKRFDVCGRCKKSRYCSADCQRADWDRHKAFCRKDKAAEAA